MRGEGTGGGEQNTGGLILPRACISLEGAHLTLTVYWRGVGSSVMDDQSACDPREEGIYDDPALPPGNNHWRRVLVVSTVVEGVFG